MKITNKSPGFTLLEILIAMFIFAILALLLSTALHNVINVQSRTEQNAEQLHDIQMALLMLSRDISQTINRPVIVANGKEEAAFVGKPNGFTFTHTGVSNAEGRALKSTLQRVRYFIDGTTLWKNTWPVLDQAPQSAPLRRALLSKLDSASFEYLDSKNIFHPEWPPQDGAREVLPHAVRVNLVVTHGGKLRQLYIVPAEAMNAANQPTKLPRQASTDKLPDKP